MTGLSFVVPPSIGTFCVGSKENGEGDDSIGAGNNNDGQVDGKVECIVLHTQYPVISAGKEANDKE